jgi:hypothetical protein
MGIQGLEARDCSDDLHPASVLSLKFIEEFKGENAGPSTPVAAATSAQDDRVFVYRINDSAH